MFWLRALRDVLAEASGCGSQMVPTDRLMPLFQVCDYRAMRQKFAASGWSQANEASAAG